MITRLTEIKIVVQILMYITIIAVIGLAFFFLGPDIKKTVENTAKSSATVEKSIEPALVPILTNVNELAKRLNENISVDDIKNFKNNIDTSIYTGQRVANSYGVMASSLADFFDANTENSNKITTRVNRSLDDLDKRLDKFEEPIQQLLTSGNQMIGEVNTTFPIVRSNLTQLEKLQTSVTATVDTTNTKLPSLFDANIKLQLSASTALDSGAKFLNSGTKLLDKITKPMTFREKLTSAGVQFILGSGAGVLRR